MLSLFKYLNRFNANMSGRIYFWTLCILFVISFIIPAPSAGQAKVDSDFNTAQMINSPASVGMGNCVINHVNNQSAFYNPGAFGIYHLDNWLSISLPNTTKLAGFDDLLYKSFSIGLSIVDPRNIRNSENNNEVIFNLALAYSRIKFGLENVLVTNYYYPVGNENYKSYFSAFDEVDCFTVGVGIDHHIILGLGITYKHFKSTHSEKSVIETYEESVSGNMFDFGVLLEIPFSEFGEVGQNNGNKIEFGFSAA
ncbi:MAG: hypothetical protein GY865_17885, partial [candidate division Zixibacteria bacterium]|nr:hypothetical protein [candidate division Zixibacteria bacterium]